ncbi:MAG: hypothetical protein A4S09_09645 [Proteobacteria bacterium SG_bin7]|nr:MAG: hypothetical protein A4S09_09645 [Proteobacteria bacterium SG_bin7]
MNRFILVSVATLLTLNADASIWGGRKKQQAPNEQQVPTQGQGQSQSTGVQKIRFEDLRVACETPAKYHNQTAPTNIQIGCQDLQLKWVPDTGKDMSVKTSRQLTVLAYSDKYNVEAVTAILDSAPQSINCPRFKQIAEKVESMRSVTCADILAFKGTAADFCAETINGVKGANPGAAQVTDTGKAVDLCGGNVSQQAPTQGQGNQTPY